MQLKITSTLEPIRKIKTRVIYKCKGDNCQFYVRATKNEELDQVQIRAFHAEHNCHGATVKTARPTYSNHQWILSVVSLFLFSPFYRKFCILLTVFILFSNFSLSKICERKVDRRNKHHPSTNHRVR